MPSFIIPYIATVILFLGLDMIWFTLSLDTIYKPGIGSLLLDKPNFVVAGLFYLFYAVGIIVFSTLPALAQESWVRAAWSGALLGLIAYGTYNFTNMATLKNWSTFVSIVDMCWGTFATATAAVLGYFITRYFS